MQLQIALELIEKRLTFSFRTPLESLCKNLFKKYDTSLAQRLDQYFSSFRYARVMSAYRNEGGFFTPLEDFNYDFGNLKMVVMSHDREAYKAAPRFYNVGDKWADMQKSIA